jgi:ABC-type cobalt transport system substrate-binding protein
MGVIVVMIVRMVMIVTMIMAVLVTMACISAAYRIKGSDDLVHSGIKALQHRLDDVIA